MSSATPSPSRPTLTPPRRSLFSSFSLSPNKRTSIGGRNWTSLLLLSALTLGFSLGLLASSSIRTLSSRPVASSSSSARSSSSSTASSSPHPTGPGWGDATGSNKSEVFFHIEPFESGLNNERISLLKAAEVASRRGWTLVLPSYKDFHGIAAGDATSGVVLPFSHFYDEEAFARHAASKGFRVVRTMPDSRFHACTKQMSLASTWPRAITSRLIDSWAAQHGVACLLPHAVWFAIRGYDVADLNWDFNQVHAAGLRPSEVYRGEVEGMLRVAAEKFGGGDGDAEDDGERSSSSAALPSFIAVHVRIENDWRRVCDMAQNRSERHWLTGDGKMCLVPEGLVAERVLRSLGEEEEEKEKENSGGDGSKEPKKKKRKKGKKPLAFVMSADPTSSMPALCGKAAAAAAGSTTKDEEEGGGEEESGGALRCFTPDDVWLDPDPTKLPFERTKLVRAYVSFLFAKEAGHLFGNVHSTFSRELGDEMRSEGKRVEFYNPPCPSPAAAEVAAATAGSGSSVPPPLLCP